MWPISSVGPSPTHSETQMFGRAPMRRPSVVGGAYRRPRHERPGQHVGPPGRLPGGAARGGAAAVRPALPPARDAAAGDPRDRDHRDPARRGCEAPGALQDPAPGGRAARPARRHRLARAGRLPADPPVRRPDGPLRGGRAGDRRRPREGLRRRDRPERGRGGRQGPEVRRALHRPAGPPDRAAHLDRPERGRRARSAHPHPDHQLLHGDPSRAPDRGAGATRAATEARARAGGAERIRSSWIGGWRAWRSTCS